MESSTAQADPTITKASQRVWEVNCYLPTEQGLIPDPAELERSMVELGGILSRIGGVVSIASVRKEITPGRVVTTGLLVRWDSFVPKVQMVAPESEEAEPVQNGGEPAE